MSQDTQEILVSIGFIAACYFAGRFIGNYVLKYMYKSTGMKKDRFDEKW